MCAVPNAKSFQAGRVLIQQINTPYGLPDFKIPDGFELKLKSPAANGGVLSIAHNRAQCTKPEASWPMDPGDPHLPLKIDRTADVFVSGTVLNDYLYWLVEEQRS